MRTVEAISKISFASNFSLRSLSYAETSCVVLSFQVTPQAREAQNTLVFTPRALPVGACGLKLDPALTQQRGLHYIRFGFKTICIKKDSE